MFLEESSKTITTSRLQIQKPRPTNQKKGRPGSLRSKAHQASFRLMERSTPTKPTPIIRRRWILRRYPPHPCRWWQGYPRQWPWRSCCRRPPYMWWSYELLIGGLDLGLVLLRGNGSDRLRGTIILAGIGLASVPLGSSSGCRTVWLVRIIRSGRLIRLVRSGRRIRLVRSGRLGRIIIDRETGVDIITLARLRGDAVESVLRIRQSGLGLLLVGLGLVQLRVRVDQRLVGVSLAALALSKLAWAVFCLSCALDNVFSASVSFFWLRPVSRSRRCSRPAWLGLP